ncbi:MAG: hypothetical protein Q4F47_02820 [Bacteroidaceae bacterium]|nr:hypothetical protein [Bacteroidaceae bacterium]
MKRCVFAMLFLLMAFTSVAQEMVKGTGKIYLFGVSQQLTDSVVYITAIHEVDSIDLEKKTSFLPYRAAFSYQLESFLEDKLYLANQTSCVFYSEKRKKLSKELYKVKKFYLDNPEKKVVILNDADFKFRHPVDVLQDE